AAEPDGISASATSAMATTSTAARTGPISVFQCGCRSSTGCSPGASEDSGSIRHIVPRSAQVHDVARGNRQVGAGRRADQQPPVRVHPGGQAVEGPAPRQVDPDAPAQGGAPAGVLGTQ